MNNFWFKRKRYGYGWTPSTRKGWIVIAIYVGAIIVASLLLLGDEPNASEAAIFTAAIAALTLTMIVFVNKKAPKPKWRWGDKRSDNPELDS